MVRHLQAQRIIVRGKLVPWWVGVYWETHNHFGDIRIYVRHRTIGACATLSQEDARLIFNRWIGRQNECQGSKSVGAVLQELLPIYTIDAGTERASRWSRSVRGAFRELEPIYSPTARTEWAGGSQLKKAA